MAYVAKTKERVYYKDVVVVEQAVNGTYSFTPEKDVLCEITLVGAGAGGAFNSSSNRSSAAAGGSASGCIILAVLKAGQTYNAVVGKGGIVTGGLDMNVVGGPGGDTLVKVGSEEILVAHGGIGGHVWWPNSAEAGAPAPLPTVATENPNIEFKKWIFSKQGIPGAIMGNPSAGGPSVLDGTTYGQGGQAWNAGGSSRGEVGKDGYVKVVYKEVVPSKLETKTYYCYKGTVDSFGNDISKDFSYLDTPYLTEGGAVYYYNEGSKDIEAYPSEDYSFSQEGEILRRTAKGLPDFWWEYERYPAGDFSTTVVVVDGEWDNYEDVIKSYVIKRKKLSIPQGTFKPNYTVVGSPTVNNGVASGFSQSNFLKLPEIVSFGSNSWEIGFKFIYTPSSANQILLYSVSSSATGGTADGNVGSYGITLQIINNTLSLYLSNTTSWNIANGLKGATTLIDGTTYYVKLSYNGIAYNLYLSETGIFNTPEITVNSSNTIPERHISIGCIGDVSVPFLGSIDLKESYIKIGSEIWWNCKYSEDVYDSISYAVKRKIRKYYKNTELFDANIINGITSEIGTVSYSGAAVYQSNAWDCFGYTRIGFKTNTATGSGQSEITFNEVQPAGFYTFKADNTQNGTATFSVTFNDGTTQTLAQVTAGSTKVPVAETRIYLSKPVAKAKVAFTSSNWGWSGGWSFAKGEEVSTSDDWDYYVDTEI